MPRPVDVWLAAGVRTPFAKVDGPLAAFDAIELSVPVARHMVDQLKGGKPDFAVWGVVVPSLTFSNCPRGADGCRHRRHGAGLLDRHGLLDQHDGRHRGGRDDRRRELQSRPGGRRRQPEPHSDRPRPAPVGLAAQVPAGALARPEARPGHPRPSQGYSAVHPGDRQSHDGPQHGRTYRDHRQGMADRPAGAGRDRAAEPPARRRGLGERASSTIW